jgi:hypothetical protein
LWIELEFYDEEIFLAEIAREFAKADPRISAGSAGAPIKYPGLKEFVKKRRLASPKVTWKQLFQECRKQFEEMPDDPEALKEYCRNRPNKIAGK